MKITTLIACAMMTVSTVAHAAVVRVSEQAAQAIVWTQASRASELAKNLGLASAKPEEFASKLQQFVASNSAFARGYAKQMEVFKAAIAAGMSVNDAFNKAFVTADGKQVLNASNLHLIAAKSAEETSNVVGGIVNAANDNAGGKLSCEASVTSYLSGSRLAKYNAAIKTAKDLTGVNVVGGTNSCANWDAEMANGVAELILQTDKKIQAGSRNYAEAFKATYKELMAVNDNEAKDMISQMKDQCSMLSDEFVQQVVGL